MHLVSPKTVSTYILRLIRPFPLGIMAMFLVAFVWAIDVALRPYLMKMILDSITQVPKQEIMTVIGPVIGGYLFLSFMLSTVYRLYDYFVNYKMVPEMRRCIALHAVKNLLGQSHQFYQNNFTGSLVNKVNDLANSVPDILHILVDRFFSLFLILLFSIWALWQVHFLFALFTLAWAGTFIIGALLLTNYMNRLSSDWAEQGSKVTGKMVDALSNILTIRLFARKKDEITFLDKTFTNAVKAEQRVQWANFWIWFVYGYSFFISLVFNFYFLIKGYQEGWLTVGDFIVVLSINTSIVEFMWEATHEFPNFTRLGGKIIQALRSILAETTLPEKENAPALVIKKGEIKFEGVRFHYHGAEVLFNNKSVHIQPGEKVGLVGYSGSGKTTFVNLILRLYDVTDGRITIDDQDIREVSQESLRQAISMIPQEPTLFHRTLKDNIQYGCLKATEEDVINAAKRAHAHDFIMDLPEGYESLVGERGIKLSGGQRQRLAIARAILKDAPILILDEATSQLDSITEEEIQHSLHDWMEDKTTLIIAHRLSTLLHMDRIFVFDKGQIVESGSHQELLRQEGLYKTLWSKQVGGFLPDNPNIG